MNNEDKHKSLDCPDVRDFLAKNIGHYYPREVEGIERRIERLKTEMAKMEKELEQARAGAAVFALAQSKGWAFHDVSDEILDYSSKTYFPFVGTDQEKESLGL